MYKPMLCDSCNTEEAGKLSGYAIESKIDGERIIAYVDGDDVRFINRRNNDVTFRYFSVAEKLRGKGRFVIDGEIAVLGEDGVSDFNKLQMVAHLKDEEKIRDRQKGLIFFVFDILEMDGKYLGGLPYTERRELLSELKIYNNKIVLLYKFKKFADAWKSPASKEGVIAKRLDAPYYQSRNKSWLKIKRWKEAVIKFDSFEEHENKGGITLTNKAGDRVTVCSPDVAGEIRATKFPIRVECQYLSRTKENKMRFPSFKRICLQYKSLNSRIKAERKDLGIDLCCKCSGSMKGQSHHFYCNKCYVPKYLRIGRDWR